MRLTPAQRFTSRGPPRQQFGAHKSETNNVQRSTHCLFFPFRAVGNNPPMGMRFDIGFRKFLRHLSFRTLGVYSKVGFCFIKRKRRCQLDLAMRAAHGILQVTMQLLDVPATFSCLYLHNGPISLRNKSSLGSLEDKGLPSWRWKR